MTQSGYNNIIEVPVLGLSLELSESAFPGTPSRRIDTAAPLTGGGYLGQDLSLAINAAAAATPETVVLRDAAGRAQVEGPAAPADIANKQYVDTAVADAVWRFWISGEAAPVLAGWTSVQHNLNLANPDSVLADVRLKCISDEHGYVAGEYAQFSTRPDGSLFCGIQPTVTADSISLLTGKSYTGLLVMNKGTGAAASPTLSKWRYVFRIWY